MLYVLSARYAGLMLQLDGLSKIRAVETPYLYDFLLELIRVGNTAEHNLEADTQYEQE